MIMTVMQHKHLFFPNIILCILLLHFSLHNNPSIATDDIYIPRCLSDNFVANSTYQSNLITLLSSFSSNATASVEFCNATVGIRTNTVYGLFMCRGDISSELCRDCISNATQKVASYCQLSKQAIIWNENCFIRYSNRNFFSHVEEQPQISLFNVKNVSDHLESFAWTLATTLNQVAADAANSGPSGSKKFATREAQVSTKGGRTLYSMAQCTPDLTEKDCGNCLNDAIKHVAVCCLGRIGGRILFPNCKIRFELYQFYWHVSPIPLRSPTGAGAPPSKGKRKFGSQIILIVVILVTTITSVILLVLGAYFLPEMARKRGEAVLRKKLLRDATTTLGSFQFSLATIEAATNKFSPDNKIGKSGFAQLYKGILPHGQEIAVKRFTHCSSQGFTEFKNEIFIITKLQHRNLVALLGFYLDEDELDEKILIYEYFSDKSLEYFLFDTHKERQLSWSERYQIIKGIAGAILYLHEHSRLKIIHCDLKSSNILFDHNMNPKIFDFGIAKTIAPGEAYGITRKVVGTCGYMSPEYARLGKFSEKSDVFSFGVIILEMITGKRNICDELRNVNGLLNYVWKQWNGQTLLQVLDSNIKDSYCEAEVIKYIQIGLLCVQEDPNARPSMSTIVSYISSFSIKMPSPQEPPFFIHAKKERTVVNENSRIVSNFMPASCSNNNVTISCLSPR